jgi:hypothetical protein
MCKEPYDDQLGETIGGFVRFLLNRVRRPRVVLFFRFRDGSDRRSACREECLADRMELTGCYG